MLWHTYTKEETTTTTNDGSNRRCASLCFFSFCLFPKRFCVSNRKQKRNFSFFAVLSVSRSLALSLFARFSFSLAVIFFLAFSSSSSSSARFLHRSIPSRLYIYDQRRKPLHSSSEKRDREREKNSAKIKAIDIVSPIEGWTHAEQLGSMKLRFALIDLIGSTDWMIFPREQGGEERALSHPTWTNS